MVSYPGKSSSPGYQTARSQSLPGIIPRGVIETNFSSNLRGVAKPGESSSPGRIPRRVSLPVESTAISLHFFTGLYRDSGTKINDDSYFTIKGLHFVFLQKCSRIKPNFDSLGYDTPGCQFFATKIRISLRKLNQNRKYFNLLVSGPDRFEL